MKEITLKEWSAYLPYGLKIYNSERVINFNISVFTKEWEDGNKPILRDLSDLTKEIEHEGLKIQPLRLLAVDLFHRDPVKESIAGLEKWIMYIIKVPTELPYCTFQQLLKLKFNVFQLPDELIVKVTDEFNPYK